MLCKKRIKLNVFIYIFKLASNPFDKDWKCDVNPCQNGGTCKPGRAKCVCKLGYIGTYCESKYIFMCKLAILKNRNRQIAYLKRYGEKFVQCKIY